MVEPAIGITAAAIATLRPLFKNFLNFTTKRFAYDEETSFSESTRPSGDSRPKMRKSISSGQSYTPEFAEMLGLSKFGVTTTVTAQKPPGWREKRRIARAEKERQIGDAESQTELYFVKGREDEIPDVPQWNIGIQRTTTVVIDG
jgi:hypothetical protein